MLIDYNRFESNCIRLFLRDWLCNFVRLTYLRGHSFEKDVQDCFFFGKSVAWVWEIQPLMGGDTTAAKTKSRPKINRLEFKLFDGKTFFLVNYFISQWWCCVIWEIESRNGFQFRITTAPFFFQITFRVWETQTQWNLRRIPESRNPGFENPESWKLYFPG